METLTSLLGSLEKKPILWVLLLAVSFIGYRSFSMSKDISHIQKELISINTKIDQLQRSTNEKIDRLNDRFDNLYAILLTQQAQQNSQNKGKK